MKPNKTKIDMKKIDIQPVVMVAERKTIKEAENYFITLQDTIQDKDAKFVMFVAFYVLWNTLANNYEVYLKEDKKGNKK